MNVTQYLFQSPSTSQVQVGKLDPSTKVEETATKTEDTTTSKAPQQNAAQAKTAGEILAPPTSVTNVVTPTVDSNYLLDVYA